MRTELLLVFVLLAGCFPEPPCKEKVALLGYTERRYDSWVQCDKRSSAEVTIMPAGDMVLVECPCPVETP